MMGKVLLGITENESEPPLTADLLFWNIQIPLI